MNPLAHPHRIEMAESDQISTDTSQIRNWRSIVTLIVFVLTNVNVLFPFHIPIYVPRRLADGFLDALAALRVLPKRSRRSHDGDGTGGFFLRMRFPMNFVTAPLVADLFLLAILAIGKKEVHDGTVGVNSISPIDIMVFFLSLAYIAISIDASGLIRYLAFKVLQWGGNVGHRLFFYLYAFFFALTTFIGNDPVILSGTAFLAYMTRVSSNIVHPRAWIYSQFAVANIGSAILVSSNPTNLVLATAFDIKFLKYTANIIVPVVATAVVLFPFLLYIVFADPDLIPFSIKMHELPEEARNKKPVNPNIPNARPNLEKQEDEHVNDEAGQLLSLEEIMNPFLDKGGAAFGGIVMAVTLITLLALNAASQKSGEHPVFWVTLPGAFVTFCWDIGFGWWHRAETRDIARRGRESLQLVEAEKEEQEMNDIKPLDTDQSEPDIFQISDRGLTESPSPRSPSRERGQQCSAVAAKDDQKTAIVDEKQTAHIQQRTTLVSLIANAWRWSQETFPTATTVLAHLPLPLVPFALCMFVLVQALVTKGWIPVFAFGWDHWVTKTGTVGAIGGMAFLSVILCNVSPSQKVKYKSMCAN